MDIPEIRKAIDAVDKELLAIIAKRMELAAAVGKIKKEKNMQIQDAAREAQIIETKKNLAKKYKLNPEMVEKIFGLLLEDSRRIQQEIIRSRTGNI
ncbi:chorismate mutase [Candidatus Woesearchaeota archaeon]|nr:chorismate mutase [Candidatus Woesearchaeota archaeon]